MKGRKVIGILLLLLLVLSFNGFVYGAIAPQVVVPKCKVVPAIDGKIEKGEWDGATIVTGFMDRSGGNFLDVRQIVGYITYDKENLYLAFKLPVYPSGAELYANYSKRDGSWVGDDILEILIDPHFGKYKAEEGYYQFMGNSKGYILLDKANYPAIGIYNQYEWNGRWKFFNSVDKDIWQAELSIPLVDLGVKEIKEGDKWLMHFSRTWGGKLSWTTFSPAAKTLDTPGGAAEVTFQFNAPAIHLISVEPLLKGRVGLTGEILNNEEEKTIIIETKVTTISGNKEIFSKVLSVHLKPEERYPFSIDESAELDEKNLLYLNIYCQETGQTYYKTEIPFLKAPNYPIFPEKKRQEIVFEARYLPTYEKIWVDIIDYGNYIDKEKVKEGIIRIKKDNKDLIKNKITFSKYTIENIEIPISGVIKEEGEYKIILTLLDKEGKELISQENGFLWKKFPFTDVKEGLSGEILPPYIPITLEGKSVSVLGRTYTINDLCFFDQITAEQSEPTVGNSKESLLSRPMVLYTKEGNNKVVAEAVNKLKVVKTGEDEVILEGEGKIKDIKLKIINRIEYDGLSWIDIELIPTREIVINNLIMDIPIRESQATLMHEITDTIRRTYAGNIPEGEGIVWDSTRIMNLSLLGNFKPLYWLGNEDRGICWCGESDKGWYLDDEKAAIEILRENKEVILRLNFINKGLVLNKVRKISFGIQATPVKPLPEGWRSWVAPYTYSFETKFKNLKYFNFSPVGVQRFWALCHACPYPADWEEAKKQMVNLRIAGRIPFLYEQIRDFVPDIPEHKVYQGEWAKTGCYGAESFADFKSWALKEYLKRCGFFTFYEDNAFLSPIRDIAMGYGYFREDGQYQGEFAIIKLRELLKREADIYYQKGYPNYIAVHKSTTMMPPCYSFITIAEDGEQRFMNNPDTDYIDQFPLDYIKAHIMGRQFGFVPFFMSSIHLGKENKDAIRKGTRSEFALLLLHEIISWPARDIDNETVNTVIKVNSDFNLGAKDVIFYPYWGKDSVIKTDSDTIKVSLWKRPRRILAVVANLGEQKETKIKIDFDKLKFTPKNIKDYESNEVLLLKNGYLNLNIPRHDFRLIWIE